MAIVILTSAKEVATAQAAAVQKSPVPVATDRSVRRCMQLRHVKFTCPDTNFHTEVAKAVLATRLLPRTHDVAVECSLVDLFITSGKGIRQRYLLTLSMYVVVSSSPALILRTAWKVASVPDMSEHNTHS